MGVGIFGTLQIAKEALLTNQSSIAVTSNNIANVNTPGYSRQSPVIETWEAQKVGGLVFGRGSRIGAITKSYDQFINNSIVAEKSVLGWWQSKESSMSQIETVFNESSGIGVNMLLNNFWNSWHDVADSPETPTERGVLQADGQSLSSKFNKMVFDLKNVQSDANDRIINTVEKINNLSMEIADLNARILGQEGQRGNANSLTDQRSLKTEELSQLIDVQVLFQNNNQVTILTVSGQPLVADNESWELKAEINPENSNFYSIKHVAKGITRDLTNKIKGGELKGLLEIRDETVPEYIEKLDYMAATLISEVNKAHFQGYGLDGSTANYFFNASNIYLEEDNSNTGGADIYDAEIFDPTQILASDFEVKFVSGSPQESKYEIYDELNDKYLFSMDAGNSSFVFRESGVDKLISVEYGTYTGKELAAEIERQMDEVAENIPGTVMDYSVTYNEDERGFLFKNLGNKNSQLLFSDTNTTISEILGFHDTDITLTPIATAASDYKSGVYSYAAQMIEIENGINNIITFDVGGGGDYKAVLTTGTYTPAELAAEIEKQLIAVSGSNFNVNFSTSSQKFIITNNTGSGVNYKFSDSSAASTLNFDSVDEDNVASGSSISSTDSRYAERKFDIVTGTNDEIYFFDEGIDTANDIIAVIPQGRYTGEELAAEIEKQMEATKGSSGQDYAVTFNTLNGNFSIRNKYSNLHDLDINWTASAGAAATLGYGPGIQNIGVGTGVTSAVTVGEVVSYDTIKIYGISFKIADKTSLPKRGDTFKMSTVKDAAQEIKMDGVTASDTDKIATALIAIDIDGSNNTIVYDDDGVLSDNRDAEGNLIEGKHKKIIIPSGRYTPEELAAQIEKLLEENSPGDSYAVEFDRDTHKFSLISNPSNADLPPSGDIVTFLWEAEETTAEYTLGFSTETFSITENLNDQMAFMEGPYGDPAPPGGDPDWFIAPNFLFFQLDPGTYTGDKMATEIEEKMNAVSAQVYEVTFNHDTRGLTITNTGTDPALNTVLDWNSPVGAETARTLGFDISQNDYLEAGSSTVSDYAPGSLEASGNPSSLIETSDFSVAEVQVGDNRNALNITDIEDQKLLEDGSLSFDAYYNILNGDVGSKTAETSRGAEQQTYMVTQYEERRTSISGVSIDEEMINLIKYQQAYAVSAKLISTLDQMLDVLVNI
jgi:flagellar hook-associated protein 1 FlgK